MSAKRTYSDEELTAFLDAEMDPAEEAKIMAALNDDSTLAARIDRLRIDVEQFRSAGTALLDAAPAVPPILSAESKPGSETRSIRYLPAIAAALVFFVIGVGVSRLLNPAPEESWQDFAAVYHALYVNKTLAHVAKTEEAANAELDRVTSTIGRSLDKAMLAAKGLDYKRAQILGYKGKPLLQLAYLSNIGAPVALCIYKSGTTKHADVRSEHRRGLSAAAWSKGGYEYLLIGGQDQALIDAAAAELARKI